MNLEQEIDILMLNSIIW